MKDLSTFIDKDDEFFIAYCEIGAKTQSVAFSGSMINRLKALAGNPAGLEETIHDSVLLPPSPEILDLCSLAKVRLRVLSTIELMLDAEISAPPAPLLLRGSHRPRRSFGISG